MISRSSPTPLYLQIEEEVRDLVGSGDLRPLDRVPSESELSERFGVSRMTARKSLDRLVDEGLLFRRPGKGTFVAPQKIEHGVSTKLSFSAAMKALGLQHDTSVLQAGIVPAPRGVGPALRETEGAPVVLLRRLRVVQGQPAALHAAYLPTQYAGILEGDLTGSLTELMAGAGARVAQSYEIAEAISADTETAGLLGVHPGAPLLRVEGVSLSSDQKPLRYTDALYRGDRFRFTIDTSSTTDPNLEVKD